MLGLMDLIIRFDESQLEVFGDRTKNKLLALYLSLRQIQLGKPALNAREIEKDLEDVTAVSLPKLAA